MENKENIDTKPKKNKKEKKGFFKKVYYSITKIERFPEMAAEGLPKAISYFIKIVAILAIISCLGTIYQTNQMLNMRSGIFKK